MNWLMLAAILLFVLVLGLAVRLNLGTEQIYDRGKIVKKSNDEDYFRILQTAKMTKALLLATCIAGAILAAGGAIELDSERPPWVFSVAFVIAGLLLTIYAGESIYLRKIETLNVALKSGDTDYWVLIVMKLVGSFIFLGAGLFMFVKGNQ